MAVSENNNQQGSISIFFIVWKSFEISLLPQFIYCIVPKFSDAKKLCCRLPKIQTKMPNLREFRQEGANGVANSEDPDQTAPLGVV